MRLIAKFVKALPVMEGETDRGHWMRGGMIVRTLDERETLVAFTAYGEDRVKRCSGFKVDDIIQVNFTPESREFGEKWYTDLRMLSASMLGQGVAPTGTDDERGGVRG